MCITLESSLRPTLVQGANSRAVCLHWTIGGFFDVVRVRGFVWHENIVGNPLL